MAERSSRSGSPILVMYMSLEDRLRWVLRGGLPSAPLRQAPAVVAVYARTSSRTAEQRGESRERREQQPAGGGESIAVPRDQRADQRSQRALRRDCLNPVRVGLRVR